MKKLRQKNIFREKNAASFGFTSQDIRILKNLDSPKRVQDFLERLKFNFEANGDSLMSPFRVLRSGRAHCIEGAIFAAFVFWLHGRPPLLLDLRADKKDFDHVVALFKERGLWGAVSKTNHAVLRYREPVYTSVRELALSYFHEYFLHNGRKTLRNYSQPFDLRKYSRSKNKDWAASQKNIWFVAEDLDASRHSPIAPAVVIANFRKADPIEIAAGRLILHKRPKIIHPKYHKSPKKQK